MKKSNIMKSVLPLCLIVLLCGCGTHTPAKKGIGGAIEKQTFAETKAPIAETSTEAVTAVTEAEPITEADASAGGNETVTLTDASGDFTYTGEVQWIGDEEHGYLQVPADYNPFQDVDTEGLVQYCYGPYNIITLQRFEGTSADTAAFNIYNHLEEEAAADSVSSAEVEISDYTAKQIYAYYPDSSQYLVTWFIPDPDDENSCYYLSMEFDAAHSDMVACSSTFTPHRN